MICVKKWVKKEKELSTKNNIFLQSYLQAKLFLNSIIFSEVKRIEEENMLKELLDLQEMLRIRQEEEEKRLASLTSGEVAADNLSEDSIATPLNTVEHDTPSTEVTPIEGDLINTENVENILETELPTEESIREKYKLKIKELMILEPKVLYQEYGEFFNNFNFFEALNIIISELTCEEELFEEKKTPILLENLRSFNSIDFSKNIFLNPLLILFFSKINQSNGRMFEKIEKFKINRIRFKKKKKLRKIHIIRKIKKITFFRKIKRRFFSNFYTTLSLFRAFSKSSSNILVKRIPLSQRVVQTTDVEFFYKLNKHTKLELLSDNSEYFEENFDNSDDLLIYLRNYHQKPYLKLRKARVTHWKLFFNKTIRKQRYKGFISWYMRKYQKLSYVYSFFNNFFTNFKISWFRMNKLESFYKTILVENHNNEIIKVPLLFSKVLKWKILKQKNYYARKRVGKWSYLNFRRATCPWLQRKKNAPKVAKHLQPNLFYLNYISNWDSMTGYVLLDESVLQHSIPASDQFKTNFLLKLHMYRYKANNKCM